jgi:polysaccharide export outer membrane protein
MKFLWIPLAMMVVATAAAAEGQSTVNPESTVSVTRPVSPNPSEPLRHRGPSYRIQAGDTFDLDFPISPAFNQSVAVQPDGYVTLKNIGSIEAQGKTVPELTEIIKTVYGKILRDPIVTIALKDFEKPYFIAGGQVGRPGKYDLRGSLTVTEAVAIAGGFTENSKHSQVVLFRPTSDGMFESKVLDIKHLLQTRNLSEDIRLQPGDMLYVPQNEISKIRKFLPSSSVGAYLNPIY